MYAVKFFDHGRFIGQEVFDNYADAKAYYETNAHDIFYVLSPTYGDNSNVVLTPVRKNA
jgi:hypothetical protein